MSSGCLSLTFLTFPPLLLAFYLFAQFPRFPDVIDISPSLASLPADNRAWQIYPEDFYSGGAYVTFPHGRMRYWLLGPEQGKKVILIHGLSVPAIIWKDVAPVLASNGYRVLVYDLYGRGYSDAPNTVYDPSLYAVQLALLMQYVRWEKAYIVGVSMGGGIAAAFSTWFPHLVDGKVALIASAGLIEPSDMSRTARFMSSPLVQSVTSSAPFRFYLQKLAASSPVDPIHEIVRIQSAHLPGYNAALASSLRDGPIRGLGWAFDALSASSNDVLLIWGTSDNTVPYKHAGTMHRIIPRSQLVTVEGGGHDLTISHPETVNKALLRLFETKT
ncbi:alpha/beta-hydrolase [Vararia minispora EC-137]|uniref:Alpha/beta-hydrolase n=1 Tax=Vararia minispora EC-137 TaxID=1314806 RepID=A0ACB8QJX0_9AGAM|nr:alpha/beta-hydrolase [Vararia minispora EC-137]